MDEDQWARIVLKHWLLGDAATGTEHRAESTNGVVDSVGKCHSERVLLELNGVKERSTCFQKRGRDEDTMMLDAVQRDGDAGSIAESLPIRCKRRKYAEYI